MATLAELALDPWHHFCGIPLHDRVLKVLNAALRESKRIAVVHLPLALYGSIERWALRNQAAFGWGKDHFTWRVLGGEVAFRMVGDSPSYFCFDDGGMQIDINPPRPAEDCC